MELIAVVVIIGIIATLLMPRIVESQDEAKANACQHDRMLINSAIERFAVVNNAYPTSLSDLNVPDYFPSGIPSCPVTGAAYSLNSTTHRVDGHTGGSH